MKSILVDLKSVGRHLKVYRKKWLVGVGVVVILVAGFYFYFIAPFQFINEDTTLEGDQVVKEGKSLIVRDGSTLTINGDLTVNGLLDCEGGGLNVVVNGDLTVNNVLSCQRSKVAGAVSQTGRAISMVVTGSVNFAAESLVIADGHIQIVDRPELLADTPEQMAELFNSIGEADSNVDSGEVSGIVSRARAGKPTQLNIGGTWQLGGDDSDAGAAVIDFSIPGGKITFQGIITLPDGEDGSPISADCDINVPEQEEKAFKNKNPRDAGRLNARAAEIVIGAFELNLGNGGRGSDAVTPEDCYPKGKAVAGHGGQSGRFRIVSTDKPAEITGPFNISPGAGGDGGTATAHGANGADNCPGELGGTAVALGGHGAHNRRAFAIIPSAAGAENIRFGTIQAGRGGDGVAYPGSGGNGDKCDCKGGAPGEARITVGRGGDAKLTIPRGTSQIDGALVIDGAKGERRSFEADRGLNGPECTNGTDDAGSDDDTVFDGVTESPDSATEQAEPVAQPTEKPAAYLPQPPAGTSLTTMKFADANGGTIANLIVGDFTSVDLVDFPGFVFDTHTPISYTLKVDGKVEQQFVSSDVGLCGRALFCIGAAVLVLLEWQGKTLEIIARGPAGQLLAYHSQ